MENGHNDKGEHTNKMQGPGQGTNSSVEEEKRERNKWWLQNHLLSRCSRAETLEILTNMATRHDQRPGGGTSKFKASVLEGGPCYLGSVRTKWDILATIPNEGNPL